MIVYVFTTEFFLEVDGIDMQAMDAVNMEKDFKIIYKKKPRTVNLCPYCRAVVGAVIMFPFVVLWRLFPHKKKIRTHQEILKRAQRTSKIVRVVVISLFTLLGFWHLSHESYYLAAFNFGLIVFNIFSIQIFRWIAKIMPKSKYKVQHKEPRKPSKFVKIISEKHDLMCPPIFFVDTTDEENLT